MHHLPLYNKENGLYQLPNSTCSIGQNRPSPGTLIKVHINLASGRTLDIQNENHWRVGVGKDLGRSFKPTSLLWQVVQHQVQVGFKNFQRDKTSQPLWAAYSSVQAPSKKETFLYIWIEAPMFQFVCIIPCPVTGQHWRESGPRFLTATLKTFVHIAKVPVQLSLLQAKLAQFLQPFLIREMMLQTLL